MQGGWSTARCLAVATALICVLVLAGAWWRAGRQSQPDSPRAEVPPTLAKKSAAIARLRYEYGGLPLSFEPSRSESEGVKFRARAGNLSVELTPREAIFVQSGDGSENRPRRLPFAGDGLEQRAGRGTITGATRSAREHPVIRMRLEGANASARIEGEDQLPGVVNYFIGDDSSQWRVGIPTYAKVKYRQVYPGIDLVYYGNHRQLECDLNLAPGAKPDEI